MAIARFISDIATPHVNALLGELRRRPGLELDLWYAGETFPGYPTWKANPTHTVQRANLYGFRLPAARLLTKVIARPTDVPIVAGWSNPTTRTLLALFYMSGRPFVFFSDEPAPTERPVWRSALRVAYLNTIRRQAVVLATGKNAVNHFIRQGVTPDRVLNAPIPTLVPANLEQMRSRRAAIRQQYRVPEGGLLFVGGSRLIKIKGFDFLIEAVARLDVKERALLRLVIVGSGPEGHNLQQRVKTLQLTEVVRFEPWMELADFEQLFAAADVAVHPARFDGYGATTLMAVAMGLPTIGTHSAGSAAELIEPGVNGFLYEARDTVTLAKHMRTFLRSPELASRMGLESARFASKWSPERVADVFVQALHRIQ